MAKVQFLSKEELIFIIPTGRATSSFKDISGQRFGKLIVLGYAGESKWFCECDCGSISTKFGSHLKRGLSKSCSCGAIESRTKHGHQIGGIQSGTYTSWRKMLYRCNNEKSLHYASYGGRGIKICERWLSFPNFLADMGVRPAKYTIERIDNNGNYEPGNCRWATRKEQSRNTRANHIVTIGAFSRPVTEWAEIYDINPGTVFSRIHGRGWEDEKAVLTPVKNQ